MSGFKVFSFEKLIVWQESQELCISVYSLTNSFPQEERYLLTSQSRRAIVSVCSNIAEGSSRWSRKEKVRFNEIAHASLMELLNLFILANRLGLIIERDYYQNRKAIESISFKLTALSKSYQ